MVALPLAKWRWRKEMRSTTLTALEARRVLNEEADRREDVEQRISELVDQLGATAKGNPASRLRMHEMCALREQQPQAAALVASVDLREWANEVQSAHREIERLRREAQPQGWMPHHLAKTLRWHEADTTHATAEDLRQIARNLDDSRNR